MMDNKQDIKNELALSNSQLESLNLGNPPKSTTESTSRNLVRKKNLENLTDSDFFSLDDFIVERGFLNAYLDRLTIVGNLPEEYEGLEEPFGAAPWKIISRFTGGGWRGQLFPDRKQKLYCEYDPENAKVMRKRNFRVECNPNLLTIDQLHFLFNEILPVLKKVSISRLDLAFDFERNLSEFVFEKSVSGGKFWGKDGRTQTIYFGSPNSDFRIRVYDKKAERLAKGSEEDKEEYKSYDVLWRLEYELTGSSYIENQVRKDFRVIQESKITKRNYDIELPVPLSAIEKLILKNYDVEKDLFSELGKNTKTKYKKLAERISDVDLTDGLRNIIKQLQICSDEPQRINIQSFCNAIYKGENPLRKE